MNPTEQANTHGEIPDYQARQARLATLLYKEGLDSLALNPGPSLIYLTGLHFHLMERPVVAFFTPHSPVTLVLPELEAGKTSQLPFPIQAFPYSEDPDTWQAAFRQAVLAAELEKRRIGVEPTRLRFLELQYLQTAAREADFISGEKALAGLRMRKDPMEIRAMQRAVDIAQRALRATLPMVKPGVTEREIASELVLQLLRAGSQGELPFTPIVSGGPNGANPHATPGDRPLQSGDFLVIDWGAADSGYFSDLTRTFGIGEVEEEYQRIHAIVQQANAAGRAAIKPGIPAGEVDLAARQVIEAAGYGEAFFHRTGHGLGMEGHEEPYIRANNPLILEPGMTFTIEPGIYLVGRNGVRIEDNVVVTESGGKSLSDMPRELEILS